MVRSFLIEGRGTVMFALSQSQLPTCPGLLRLILNSRSPVHPNLYTRQYLNYLTLFFSCYVCPIDFKFFFSSNFQLFFFLIITQKTITHFCGSFWEQLNFIGQGVHNKFDPFIFY